MQKVRRLVELPLGRVHRNSCSLKGLFVGGKLQYEILWALKLGQFEGP